MTDIESLVALGEGITPGPWMFNDGAGQKTFMGGFFNADHDTICTFGNRATYYPIEGEPPSPADARAIAAVPDLIAAIRTLQTEKVELREALKGMLRHSCVADTAPEDKDGEDHIAEHAARQALSNTGEME